MSTNCPLPGRALFLALGLLQCAPAFPQVVINEVLAEDRSGFTDEDGNPSAWVELFHAGDTSLSLDGWWLARGADPDAERWRFPVRHLAPREFLVVFLSGKDRSAPDRELHAGFALRKARGRVRLLAPDGVTAVSEMDLDRDAPAVSRGRLQTYTEFPLVGEGSAARFHVPAAPVPGAAWRAAVFDDAAWKSGGVGTGRSPAAAAAGTADSADLRAGLERDLRGQNTTALVRFPFDVEDLSGVDALRLRIRAADGFVAWINGVEVARCRVAGEPAWNTAAAEPSGEPEAGGEVVAPVRDFRRFLTAGRNVLAIQLALRHRHAERVLLDPELVAVSAGTPRPESPARLARPTPGLPNGVVAIATTEPPVLDPPSRLFAGGVDVAIRAADPEDDGPPIRVHYTLDGSDPGADSPAYDRPIRVSATAMIKARGFRDGHGPGPAATGIYVAMDPGLRRFTSDLPILAVTPFGLAHDKIDAPAHLHVIDGRDDEGRASFQLPAGYSGFAAIRTRGSSTLRLPKRGYALETRDADGNDRGHALLGLAADSDWILQGAYHFDHSHIRNALAGELARRMGRWAPRGRFVEVFVNAGADRLTPDDHAGLYWLTEKIKRGRHRVDIENLQPDDAVPPAVTGGYILKVDRPGPGDKGFTAGGQKLQLVHPKEREITDPQRRWIREFLDAFGASLNGPAPADPEAGYGRHIDVDSFIDYHVLNEYTGNPDAYTLSTYMHLPRGGKLRMGPVWDFDRAMRTNEDPTWVGRAGDPRTWTGDCYYGWWGVLFRDPAFRLRYRARGRELLAGALDLGAVHRLIDALAAEVAEAAARDRDRWPIVPKDAFDNDVAALKAWVAAKDAWFRAELLEAPELESDTGRFRPPFELTITHANPEGVLYYTLDGGDPKLDDGRVSPRAQAWAGPVAIGADTLVRARVRVGDLWSRETRESCATRTATLTISEVMYNPAGGRDYEFVEIFNHGDAPVPLRGVRLSGAVKFPFALSGIGELGPGGHVVVVHDRLAFATRYDVAGMAIAGEYLGRMSNTEGTIELRGPADELLCEARYQDWFKEADGKGRSLVAVVTARPPRRLVDRAAWRISRQPFGSPGARDP